MSNGWDGARQRFRNTLQQAVLHVGARGGGMMFVSGWRVLASIFFFVVVYINPLSLSPCSPYMFFNSKSRSQYKIMQKRPVVIHQSPQNQSSHRSATNPSTMDRRPTYEAIKADPSTLKPRTRTTSSASSSSSSSSSSTSLSRRKLIRDRYKRPWQLMSVITLHQDEVPSGRSGGLKSPYPTPGRRNYDRV